MTIDLKEMTLLAPIFRELLKGYHLSRDEAEHYAQLSTLQDQYRALFKALGFELICDPRGFYYFMPEQMGAQVNKTAQRLALLTFILIEYLADQGRDPLSVLDGGRLGKDELPALFDKYRELFLQAEISELDELEEKLMRRLSQLGFIRETDNAYRFLAPMHRFLDVCLAVQYDRSLNSAEELPMPVLADDDGDPDSTFSNAVDDEESAPAGAAQQESAP